MICTFGGLLQRRQFLNATAAMSALTLAGKSQAQSPAAVTVSGPREYYQIRRYHLQSGPQTALCQDYFAKALIPALNRRGMTRIGAFRLHFGPQTPMNLLVIPSTSLEDLVKIELNLASDETFLKAAEPFWNAPAVAAPFNRIESELLLAFEGWPKLQPPAVPYNKDRIYQLRIYESPTDRDHVRKVEMFHSGEFKIFQRTNCNPVFFADSLIGSRMPSLSYMLSFPDLPALTKGWDDFFSDPDWKKLAASERFRFEPIVSNISDLIFNPMACSQV